MSWGSLLSHVAKSGPGTSSAISSVGAKVIVVGIAYYAGGTPPAPGNTSDSLGNEWFISPAIITGGGEAVAFAICLNPTTGASHTFTCSASDCSFCVQVWGGPSGIAFDQFASSTSGGSNVGTIQAGSITPAQNGELLIAVLGVFGSTPNTINDGFTISDQLSTGAGAEGIAMAYFIQTTAAAINPTWTLPASVIAAAGIISFGSLAASGVNRAALPAGVSGLG